MMGPMDVTVIGLGKMGSALARRLHSQGFSVYGWNRTRERVSGLPIKLLSSIRDARGFIAIFVSDNNALLDVVNELRGAKLRDSVIALMGTFTPRIVTEVARSMGAMGAGVIDSPVIGGPALVERGEATYLLGGPVDLIESTKVIYSKLGEAVHVGDVGQAMAVKLAFNSLLIGSLAILGEATAMVKGHGVDPGKLMEVLSKTIFRDLVSRYGNRIVSRGTPTFTLRHAGKDVGYAVEASAEVGLPATVISCVRELHDVLVRFGYGDEDFPRVGAIECNI
jgi:3-hydroxyisobutyrate dehydrogenase-like beta-hydroxyacid dehydrogenase